MSVFKKILSVFNDLTDHTVLADDTVSANIKTKDNFLTKEFEENLLAFYDQMPAQMKALVRSGEMQAAEMAAGTFGMDY